MQNRLISTIIILFILTLVSCRPGMQAETTALQNDETIINNLLITFHLSAAQADEARYFACLDSNAVFIGTDAAERWDKASFQAWAKPYFEQGQAWRFTAVDRNITIDVSGRIAWFDELLDTQMKLCRGSGVLEKTVEGWKIKQYVLSMTIPNSLVDTVVRLKSKEEDIVLRQLISKK